MPGPDIDEVNTLIVKINGTKLATEHVTDVRVETAINLPSRVEVRFDYELGTLPFAVGDTAEVLLDSVSVFTGEVVAVGVDISDLAAEAICTAYDKSHRLGTTTKNRTFLNSSYSDILTTIAGECGSLTGQASGAALTAVHPYLVQACTNREFLNQIALRTGCEWAVEGTNLVMRERPVSAGSPAITYTLGEDLFRVRARLSGSDFSDGVTVHAWDPAAASQIEGTETAALTAAYSTAPMWSNGKSSASAFGGSTLKTTSVPAMTAAEAAKVAKGLAVRMATSTFVVKGEGSGSALAKAGVWLELANCGDAISGKYYLTAVEHVMGTNRFTTTRFTAGGLDHNSIVDLLGPTDDQVPSWSQQGVVIGIVTNNEQVAGDGKAGPGNVIVKFPALDEQITSAPARLTAAEAGSARGTYFVPEVNDEVVVAFEHGDPRRPVVLGSLWSGNAAPPYPTDGVKDGTVNARVIKTRLGHTLTFNDGTSDDKKNLTILLADGKTTLVLGHDKIQIANDKKPITVTNAKATIEFTDAGDINITGENVNIKATTAVKITTSKGAIEATSGADIKLDAKANANIGGKAGAKVESKGITVIKGSMVKIN